MAQPFIFPHSSVHCLSATPAPGTPFPDWPARMAPRSAPTYADAQRAFEVEFLTQALQEHGGNITRTAAAIGMSRRNLQIKIQKLGIQLDRSHPQSGGRRYE